MTALAAEPLMATQVGYRLESLGRSALSHADSATAIRCFGAALEHVADPQGTLHNLLGVSWLQAGDVDRALPHFEVAAASGNARAHGNLGICRHRLGDHTAARACFERAVQLAPEDSLARTNYDMACAAS